MVLQYAGKVTVAREMEKVAQWYRCALVDKYACSMSILLIKVIHSHILISPDPFPQGNWDLCFLSNIIVKNVFKNI